MKIQSYFAYIFGKTQEVVLLSDHEKVVEEKDRFLESKEVALDNNEATIIQQGNQIAALEAVVKEKEESYQSLLGHHEAQTQDFGEQIAALAAAVKEKDEEITSWGLIVDTMKKQIAALTTDRDLAMSILGDAEARVERLTAERGRLRNDITTTEAALGISGIYAKMDAEREALTAENERLREAMKGPLAWLERWAVHVGSCETNPECTCGLLFMQHELRAALAGKAEQ